MNTTFLVVDDDDLDVELIRRTFKKLDVKNPVIRAVNGVEALDILKGRNGHEPLKGPYIVLLDINMPQMSGLEFLAEIRKDSDLRKTIVFVLTTSDDCADVAKAYDMNVAGYVLKNTSGPSFRSVLTMLDSYERIVEIPA